MILYRFIIIREKVMYLLTVSKNNYTSVSTYTYNKGHMDYLCGHPAQQKFYSKNCPPPITGLEKRVSCSYLNMSKQLSRSLWCSNHLIKGSNFDLFRML